MEIIYQRQEYFIIQGAGGYVVINNNGAYENHSHFSYSMEAAKNCINFAIKRLIPKRSKYMAIACKRISTDEEYREMIDEYLKQEKGRRYLNNSFRR
ncbi:MAG: hypothetical protein ABRQ25_10780 [Clostridiaceae bacterium]